ncbi:MAG: radical SAM protein [Candidatus Woesearchaeota archaeon]
MQDLISQANKVYLDNFSNDTYFERAIFFSWYCSTHDCKFCYMSTQDVEKNARRTIQSLLAEVILCKACGWQIGFVSGGHDAYTTVEFESVLGQLSSVSEEKLWINVGALNKVELSRFLPYAKGVVASIETINPSVHDLVCPSKPIAPFELMLEAASSLGLKKAMTIILGIGESMHDFPLLEKFISKHDVDKIHFYILNPQKGTFFENAKRPSAEYQAEWIARTRIAFPTIDIQAGIWLDCVDRVELLLKAGANSISKFPAIRYFGSIEAKKLEDCAQKAGRKFIGSLVHMPDEDFSSLLKRVMPNLLEATRSKLDMYLRQMGK